MALSMWKSGENSDTPPVCKVKQIMSKLLLYPDPTEKFVNHLTDSVKNLNQETAELHVRHD